MKFSIEQKYRMDTINFKHISSYKVYFIFINRMNKFTNSISITRKALSKETNLSIQTIAKGIKELKDNNICRALEKGTYMINPLFVHYGKNQRQLEAQYIAYSLKEINDQNDVRNFINEYIKNPDFLFNDEEKKKKELIKDISNQIANEVEIKVFTNSKKNKKL